MISYSLKSTLSLNNLEILRPKVKKKLMNLQKKFCESPLRLFNNARKFRPRISKTRDKNSANNQNCHLPSQQQWFVNSLLCKLFSRRGKKTLEVKRGGEAIQIASAVES